MNGKRIKQINNLVITEKDGVYLAWTPLNQIYCIKSTLLEIEKVCNDCVLFINKPVEKIINKRPNAIQQRDIILAKKLVAQDNLVLYHGTKDSNLRPSYEYNNPNNDYGKGFYTTPDKELGKEWAYSTYTKGNKGYLYTYTIDLRGLDILDLTKCDSLHWIAELLYNRTINVENKEALQDIIDEFLLKYKLDTSKKDIIIGYRADDSYFTYATDFVSGNIYRDTLENALRYGDLGLQVFIKSEEAFMRLKQVGNPIEVDKKYAQLYAKRDKLARDKYRTDKNLQNRSAREKKRITDFL